MKGWPCQTTRTLHLHPFTSLIFSTCFNFFHTEYTGTAKINNSKTRWSLSYGLADERLEAVDNKHKAIAVYPKSITCFVCMKLIFRQ